MNRLRGKHTLTVAYICSKFFSFRACLPINFLAQLLIIILSKFIFFGLKFKFPNISKIYLRHSVSTWLSYNLFLSDVDFTVVVKDNESFDEILNFLLRLQKSLIFLGEFEIYTQSENNQLLRLQERAGDYWKLIFHLRKIDSRKIKDDQGEYGRLKRERSKLKSLKLISRYSLNLEKIYFKSNETYLINSILTEAMFKYIGDGIYVNEVSKEARLILLNIIPIQNKKSISVELRHLQELIANFEYLTCLSNKKFDCKNSDLANWISDLESWIKE